ncbi:Unknown protein sequence [Pseudomonas savastanoi pv. glycinea]|nr:Unknown protein sequence [Pseudomonas savastanoi pv. glycinea]
MFSELRKLSKPSAAHVPAEVELSAAIACRNVLPIFVKAEK